MFLLFLLFFVAVIKTSNTADSRRAYQCIKFLVQLANKCPQAKDYLLQNSSRWQWAVQWLKRKMNEHYWAPHTSSSNEYSSSRTFQRTSSAADTLAEATALLTELEAKDGEVSTSDDAHDSEIKSVGEDPSSSRTFQRSSSATDPVDELALLADLEDKGREVNTSDDVDNSEIKFEGEDWDKEAMT